MGFLKVMSHDLKKGETSCLDKLAVLQCLKGVTNAL